ncbi:DNA methyltransferase [Bacillus cereus]|uniref:DNA (cytosine-5-)-methyltransferase n=2 Tax=Bacillus cereus group TaxID=86661 RepID=A0A9X0MKQ9_BACCE|nr:MULTISPECIES: DNA (cytosine-5-)-methyltransferase [Bacillus cereus group]KXY51465.1 DNA methyltransferase [Bacillus cereus]PEZ75021.1 DNA (cytosine-5-)-methyltransferase [Bacillus anthracis]PFA29805.1 DNA (cytosine-5-)-methyltransferase [Bacillus thuringiensis]PGW13452.1 DNA (cytosine-5-)-methyltransferase [Bacillus cereus]
MKMNEMRWGMEARPQNGLICVDLFCGAGVGACGVKLAGYHMAYAVDNNPYAVKTYNKMIGPHAVLSDIRKINPNDIPDHDFMIATPVCKSFSVAGKGDGFENKDFGDLPHEFLRILKAKKPKAFLFENVNGMVNKKNRPGFEAFVKEIENSSYNVTWKLVDCYEYGIPQHRKRVFMVGIRSDLGKTFEFPEIVSKSERKTIRDAIGDLPNPDKVMNSLKDIQYEAQEQSSVHNHVGYGIRNDGKEFVHKIPVGGNWKALNEEDARKFMGRAFESGGGRTGFLRKVSFDQPAYTITSLMNGKNNAQIIDNQDKYYEGGFSPRYVSRNRQKQWNEASYTIVSEARQLPLYPEPANYDIRKMDTYDVLPPRRFTVRECLRLQTVPDWFSFAEDVPLNKQYERCSGIPSLMAYKLAIEIEKYLT